jgi:hypothetical protein
VQPLLSGRKIFPVQRQYFAAVKFDDSPQGYPVQVSVPVKDGDSVIGAITFGIDVDKL